MALLSLLVVLATASRNLYCLLGSWLLPGPLDLVQGERGGLTIWRGPGWDWDTSCWMGGVGCSSPDSKDSFARVVERAGRVSAARACSEGEPVVAAPPTSSADCATPCAVAACDRVAYAGATLVVLVRLLVPICEAASLRVVWFVPVASLLSFTCFGGTSDV